MLPNNCCTIQLPIVIHLLPVGGVLVLRYTAFGKTHVEAFAAALATILLSAASLLAHLTNKKVISNHKLCLSLNVSSVSIGAGQWSNFSEVEDMTGDYCRLCSSRYRLIQRGGPQHVHT